MDEIIQIKCPFCGSILSVKNMPGIESKSVTCPICRHKYPFTQFKRMASAPDEHYHPGGDEDTDYGDDSTTTDMSKMNYTIGRVIIIGSGIEYRLKPGRNVIGRKSPNSAADFQIDTDDRRLMSREHIVIEVKKVPAKGFVHYISLFKKKVNKTYIGNEPIEYGDCIVLSHGDIIKLPDAALKFEIPDEDATDI